jgi:hypothetical protein
VSDWAVIFLGVIAVATLTTSILQVGVLLAAGQLVRRIGRFVDLVEQEAKPILGNLNAMSHDAAHATSLATAQVERAEKVFGVLLTRLEETLETIQMAVGRPAREMAALMAGLRAAFDIIRDIRGRRPRSGAGDDGLFI